MKMHVFSGQGTDGGKGGGERGFSLIELLIALTIFAVGILAVAAMQTAAMRGSAKSTGLTHAVRGIMQDKVESLLSLGYGDSNLDGSASPGTIHPSAGTYEEVIEDGVTYKTQWTVITGVPNANAKTVSVTTTWSDLSGPGHTVTATFVKDSTL